MLANSREGAKLPCTWKLLLFIWNIILRLQRRISWNSPGYWIQSCFVAVMLNSIILVAVSNVWIMQHSNWLIIININSFWCQNFGWIVWQWVIPVCFKSVLHSSNALLLVRRSCLCLCIAQDLSSINYFFYCTVGAVKSFFKGAVKIQCTLNISKY